MSLAMQGKVTKEDETIRESTKCASDGPDSTVTSQQIETSTCHFDLSFRSGINAFDSTLESRRPLSHAWAETFKGRNVEDSGSNERMPPFSNV